MFEAG